MPIALDPKEPFDYVLVAERDLPEEDRTVFHLRGLTIEEETNLNNGMLSSQMGGDEVNWNTGDYQLSTLKRGVLGWENFMDKRGEPVPFRTMDPGKATSRKMAGVTNECLNTISSTDRTELANAITSRGKVTEDEGN